MATEKPDNPFDKAEALQKEAHAQIKADNDKAKEKAKSATDAAETTSQDKK